jgi:hypothetical protein
MGCTQSNSAVDTATRSAELKNIRINAAATSNYDASAYPQAPNSNKSMNTAKTITTNSTTTMNTISNGTNTAVSPRIVPALSYEINDDDDYDDDFEVTTECDDESVQSMLLNSGRSKASYSFFPDSRPSNTNDNNNSPYTMIDEMSTDDNHDIHDSRTYEDVPNMDESISSSNNENSPPVPCTILTIRKNNSPKIDSNELNVTSASSESSNQYHSRMLSIHQEQQKRLVSLMTTLLPWTHAIVIRKQRHIQVRQMMITSLLWFSMLLWPTITHQFYSTSTTTSTTRTRNPTTLFRR